MIATIWQATFAALVFSMAIPPKAIAQVVLLTKGLAGVLATKSTPSRKSLASKRPLILLRQDEASLVAATSVEHN